ncbi:MAG: metalloregulator ArsR/SmtB family transcription factor [Bacteroidota bacterium]
MKTKPSTSGIDIELLEQVTDRLVSMTHPMRIAILDLLQEGTFNVTEIYKHLKIEQAVCSQHLRILKKHGLLTSKREGKKIFYTTNSKFLKKVVDNVGRCNG